MCVKIVEKYTQYFLNVWKLVTCKYDDEDGCGIVFKLIDKETLFCICGMKTVMCLLCGVINSN